MALSVIVAACVQTVSPTPPDAPIDAPPDDTAEAADAGDDAAATGDGPDAIAAGCAFTMCGRVCVDTQVSSRHCGACSLNCYGEPCVAGVCACRSGLTRCTDGCVDLTRDNGSCGACGVACAAGTRCEAGACAPCPSGYLYCPAQDGRENVCGRDATSNRSRCGACGAVCGNLASTSACVAGRCVYTCAEGAAHCRGALGGCETSLRTDVAHCGACGRACEADALCIDGRCVAVPVRPVAPISTVTVTSRRPWFRWELPAGADGARVELCAARNCATVTASWEVTGDRGRAPAPLAPGDHYWRLYARRGAAVDAVAGPVWMFTVPSEIPASWTPRMDFDGDGRDDATQIVQDLALDDILWSFTVRLSGTGATRTRSGAAPIGGLPTGSTSRISRIHAWLDVNGDGYGELGLVEYQNLGYQVESARAYLGGPSDIEPMPSRSVNIFSGYGGGSGEAPTSLGDVNGDGYGDVGVVTATRGPGITEDSNVYTVAFGRGPRSSDPVTRSFAIGCRPGVVARGDFNADGFTDLVLAPCDAPGPARLSVSIGGATIELAACAGETFAASAWRAFNRVYDIDDDGYDDLADSDGRWFRGGPDGLTDARCGVVAPAM